MPCHAMPRHAILSIIGLIYYRLSCWLTFLTGPQLARQQALNEHTKLLMKPLISQRISR